MANLIKVEPRLQLAIETALGGRLQNIVTENEEDVKYLINYLKINDYGKATFLPVSSMKPHGIEKGRDFVRTRRFGRSKRLGNV